jgi:hypothetical protein
MTTIIVLVIHEDAGFAFPLGERESETWCTFRPDTMTASA